LNIVSLCLPPLRDRRDDIPLLVAHFLNKDHLHRFSVHADALRAMMLYDWPGNVRELENAVEHGATMTSGGEILLDHLPAQLQQESLAALHAATGAARKKEERPETEGIVPLAAQERHAILEAIRVTGGDKLRAARLLDIGKTTLYRKLKEYRVANPTQEN
jgi:DNA-binding NtrC family response regulator